MSETPAEPTETKTEGEEQPTEQTFTQAEVDKIIGRTRTEERRKASEKYADYDELKTKADGAKTLEDRVAEIERQARASEERAMRAEVAVAKGLTPNQAKRLIGTTREELEADADDFLADIAAREDERKKQGNRVPDEGRGTNPAKGSKGQAFAEFAEDFFTR